MKKQALQRFIVDGLFILVGTIVYSIGINMFIQPNKLTPGGITGLAVQLNHLFDLPTGILIILMNIPLFVLGYIILGGKFVVSSVVATVISSIFIDVFKTFIPIFENDLLLSSIFGGLLTGFGISLLYLRDSSMGGTDIVCTIINKHSPYFPIGKTSLLLNAIVIASAVLVFENLECALYSAVSIFVSSKVIDAVLLGVDSGKMLLTITDKPYVIAEEIHRITGRGATVLNALGTYNNNEKYLLLCVAKRFEFSKIKRIVKENDSNAFVIIGDAAEILGNGFKSM